MPDQNLPDTNDVRDIMGPPARVATAPIPATRPGATTLQATGATTIVASNVTLSGAINKGRNIIDDTNIRILDTLKSIYTEINKPPRSPTEQIQNKLMQRMYPEITTTAKRGKLTITDLLTAQPNTQFTQGYEPNEIMELTRLMTMNNFNSGKVSMQDPRSSSRIASKKATYVGEMLKVMAVGQNVFGTRDPNDQIALMNQLRMGEDRADGTIYKTPPQVLLNRMYSMETLSRKSKVAPDSIVSGLLQSQRYIDATSGRLTDPVTGKREAPNAFVSAMQIEEMTRRIAMRAGRSDDAFVNRTRNIQTDLVTRASRSRAGNEAAIFEYRNQTGMGNREEYAEYKRIAASGDKYALTEYARNVTGMSSIQLKRVSSELQRRLEPEHAASLNVTGRGQQVTQLTAEQLRRKQINDQRDWDEGQKKLAAAGIVTNTFEQQNALVSTKVATGEVRSATSTGIERAIMTQIPGLSAGDRNDMLRRYQAQEKKLGTEGARKWAQTDAQLKKYTGDFNTAIDVDQARLRALYNPEDKAAQRDAARQRAGATAQTWLEKQKGRIFDVHNIPFMGASEAKLMTGVGFEDRVKQSWFAGKAAVGIVGGGLLTSKGRAEIGTNIEKSFAIPWRAAEAGEYPYRRLAATKQAVAALAALGIDDSVDKKALADANNKADIAIKSRDKKQIDEAHRELLKVSMGKRKGTEQKAYKDLLAETTQVEYGKLKQGATLMGAASQTENTLGWVGRFARKLRGGAEQTQAGINQVELDAISSARHDMPIESIQELQRTKQLQKPKTVWSRIFGKDTGAEGTGRAEATGRPSTLTGILTVIEGQKTYSATLDGSYKD